MTLVSSEDPDAANAFEPTDSGPNHDRCLELWTVVKGNPIVTRGNEEFRMSPGESIDMPTVQSIESSIPGKSMWSSSKPNSAAFERVMIG